MCVIISDTRSILRLRSISFYGLWTRLSPLLYSLCSPLALNRVVHATYLNDDLMKPPGDVILRKFVRFVLEKWKDIGFSYNHSRTMVSQVSIADESPSEASVPVAALAAQSPADHSRSSRTSLTHRGECGRPVFSKCFVELTWFEWAK